VVPPPPATVAPTVGTIRFDITPADVAITVGGQPVHEGTPWDVKLAPGVHQIGIHRDGYKNYLTHIELSAGEDHPVKLALEPLGGTVSDGTLSIVSNPPALDVMID